MRRIDTLIIFLLASTLVAGCSSDVTETEEPVVLLGDGESVLPDDEPEERVLRTVGTRQLFGDMPLFNHVLDPEFGSLTDGLHSRHWFGRDFLDDTVYPFFRVVLPRTPTGQPVLFVDRPNRPGVEGRYRLFSDIMLRPQRMRLSVWIGRGRLDNPNALSNVTMLGYTLFGGEDRDGGVAAFELTFVPDSEVVLDGITWRRYEGSAGGFLGYGSIVIDDTVNTPLYVQAPTLIEVQVPRLTDAVAPPKLRPVDDSELELLRRHGEEKPPW